MENNGINLKKALILKQDNSPFHSSIYTKESLQTSDINVLDWTEKSLSLNMIGNVWEMLVRKVYSNAGRYNDTFLL